MLIIGGSILINIEISPPVGLKDNVGNTTCGKSKSGSNSGQSGIVIFGKSGGGGKGISGGGAVGGGSGVSGRFLSGGV